MTMMPERQMRAIVKKLQAGVDLTEQEQAALASHEDSQKRASDSAADTGLAGLAELTGVPSIARGASNISEAVSSGNVKQGLKGAGEVALGALPGASVTRAGASALSGLFSSAPKAMATLAVPGALALPMDIETAQAQSEDKISKGVSQNSEVARLRSEIDAIESERIRSAKEPIKGMSAAGAEAARGRSDAAFQERIKDLRSKLDAAEKTAREDVAKDLPFRDRYPGRAEGLLYGAAALAGGLPFVNTIKGNIANRMGQQPAIMQQAERAERALIGGTEKPGSIAALFGAKDKTVRPSEQAWERERDVLRKQFESMDKSQPSYMKNAALGTGLMMEARMIPEEIDAISYPYGHPTRTAATEALTSPSYYASGVIPSVLAGLGASGLGIKAADTLTKGAQNPALNRASAMRDWEWGTKGPPAQSANMPAPVPAPPQINAPILPQNPQRQIPPAPAATPRGSQYGPDEQSVVRPFVASEVAAGRPVPDVAATQSNLSANGVNSTLPRNMGDKLDNARAAVEAMHKAGMPRDQIVAALTEMMGTVKGLPAVAGAAAMGGTLMQDQ